MNQASDPNESVTTDPLFDLAPVSLWLEDFTRVHELLESWRAAGITDIRRYLNDNPASIAEYFSRIRVLKVNQRDSAGDLSGYSFHMADVGTDAMEREKAFLFASTEGRLLMEINEALRRVYRGEYGSCESCEKPIARARLEAMPYARLCVSCKEIEERKARGTQ